MRSRSTLTSMFATVDRGERVVFPQTSSRRQLRCRRGFEVTILVAAAVAVMDSAKNGGIFSVWRLCVLLCAPCGLHPACAGSKYWWG